MGTPHIPRNAALVEDLTGREMDVLRLKALNRSNQEIADELVLALSTVKWYVRQVYGKLGVENRQQATARAQALGLILDRFQSDILILAVINQLEGTAANHLQVFKFPGVFHL